MTGSRLSDALAEAGGLPDAGRILVLRPRADSDLSGLPRDRTVVVTGFRPDHDASAERGYCGCRSPRRDVRGSGRFRAARQGLGPRAGRRGGGPGFARRSGLGGRAKDRRRRCAVPRLPHTDRGDGGVVQVAWPGLRLRRAGGAVFAGWAARLAEPVPGFFTLPGVFSADGVDPGSALLAAHLPLDLPGKGADMGPGGASCPPKC